MDVPRYSRCVTKPWNELTVLVTGATGGLGEPLCEALAAAGANLVVHGRDRSRVEALVARLPRARGVVADLASLEETRVLALSAGPIDVLINNAGVGFGADRSRREISRDGYELRMAVNYLSPFVLTTELVRHGHPRAIVNVASAGQQALDLDDLMSKRAYDGVDAYRRSKLALIMFTFDQAKLSSVPIVALHPGTFLDTAMVRDAGITPQGTAQQGADAIKFVAEAALGGETGTYFNQKSPARADAQAYEQAERRTLRERTLELISA
jgi:NAD(P)-dependent dehydrogenase (short-subunit alcohol dehydrogenase family)